MDKKLTPKTATKPVRDGCDTSMQMLARRVNSQRRFLDAYRQRPKIARAARLAEIHRCTVYRWMAEMAFVKAMREAADEFTRECRVKLAAEWAARKRWREERERERRPMRCQIMALARAAKLRYRFGLRRKS